MPGHQSSVAALHRIPDHPQLTSPSESKWHTCLAGMPEEEGSSQLCSSWPVLQYTKQSAINLAPKYHFQQYVVKIAVDVFEST